MILGRLVTVNEVEWKLMESKGLTKEDIISVLNDGTLNFKISKKDGDSKVYVIEKEFDKKATISSISHCPMKALFLKLRSEK